MILSEPKVFIKGFRTLETVRSITEPTESAVYVMMLLQNLKIFVSLLLFQFKYLQSAEISENQLRHAVSFVTATEQSSLQTCSTWTFLLTDVTEIHQFLISTQHDKIRTFLLFQSSRRISQHSNLTTDYEHTEEELLFPTICGPFHFSAECHVVFVLNSDPRAIEYLTRDRIIRPHKDYFLYFTNDVFSIQYELRYLYRFTNSTQPEPEDNCRSHSQALSSLYTSKCSLILNSRRFRVSAILGKSFVRISRDVFPKSEGLFHEILKEGGIRFNYSFTIHMGGHGGASGFKKDGRWWGSVGEVFHNEADFGIGMGMTATRDCVIDNGISFEENKRVFFIKEQSLTPSWKAIFSPFQRPVWILIISVALILGPVYYASIWLSLHYVNDPWVNALRRHLKTYGTTILNDITISLVAVLLEQSATPAKFWIGARIRFLIFLWTVFCLVMGAGYRSRLVYFLTFITPDEEVPRTHAELVGANYKILFRNYNGIAYRFMKESHDPIQKELYKRAVLYNTSESCVVAAVLTERSACLDWKIHGSYAVATNATPYAHQVKSLLIPSSDSVVTTLVTWVYRKRSPWRDTFDTYLIHVFASGLYLKWGGDDWRQGKVQGSKWLRQHTSDSRLNEQILNVFNAYSTGPKPLMLISIYGMLATLVVGNVLALGIFVWELSPTVRLIRFGIVGKCGRRK